MRDNPLGGCGKRMWANYHLSNPTKEDAMEQKFGYCGKDGLCYGCATDRNTQIVELEYELWRIIEQEKCTMSDNLSGACGKWWDGHDWINATQKFPHVSSAEAHKECRKLGYVQCNNVHALCCNCAEKKNAQITELEKALAKIDDEYIGPEETYDPYMTWSELAVDNGRLVAELAELRDAVAWFTTGIDFTRDPADALLAAYRESKDKP